jgi:23S rRNA (uridine2552-2'-O)-methyltransferase
MAFTRKDGRYKKAKAEGYRSRASYKLIELNGSYRLIHNGSRVIDLGSFPGGWSQVCMSLIGAGGKLVAVDLREMEGFPGDNFKFINADFRSAEFLKEASVFLGGRADAVISDVSPKLTGIHFADYSASVELVQEALEFTKRALKPGGCCIAKVFPGEEMDELVAEAKSHFKDAKLTKPKSSREESAELYLVGRGFKGGAK